MITKTALACIIVIVALSVMTSASDFKFAKVQPPIVKEPSVDVIEPAAALTILKTIRNSDLEQEFDEASPRAFQASNIVQQVIGKSCRLYYVKAIYPNSNACEDVIPKAFKLKPITHVMNIRYPTKEMIEVTGKSLVVGDILWFDEYRVGVYVGDLNVVHFLNRKMVEEHILDMEKPFKKVFRIIPSDQ